MTRIKICGITSVEDARAAIDYGADALGFVLVPGSPRFVAPSVFVRLGYEIPLWVSTVAVAQRPEDVGDYFVTSVQFYEEDSLQTGPLLARSPGRFVRAFRVRNEASLEAVERYEYRDSVAAYLLDTYHDDKLGGSGETFPWGLALEAKRRTGKPILLAGGLTPDNVADAIAQVRPYAVDVSSGVEAEPGRKDHEKLRRFIRAVRQADAIQ